MTSSLNWHIKTFSQLTTNELYDLLKLRIDVFVVEQTCFYPDLDDKDRHNNTLHIFAYDKSSPAKLAAYLRILPKGESYKEYPSIGRVVTAPEFRGHSLGHTLMSKALDVCMQHYPNDDIKISAQQHLKPFYNQHGFKQVSAMYLEDDIPHIAMLKSVSD